MGNMGRFEIAERFVQLEDELARQLCDIPYDERVKFIYNPLDYARETHRNFIFSALTKRQGSEEERTEPKRDDEENTGDKPDSAPRVKVLFLGINPGPYGMAQNGVPFGDTDFVRDWLGICGAIQKPYREHPKRPVEGFKCKQREMSGKRFWTLIKDLCGGKNELFFGNCLIYNFCPLSFMEENARNITPDQLRGEGKKRLLEACDEALRKVIDLIRPEMVVGVGKFAFARAQAASEWLNTRENEPVTLKVFDIPHPSPASPEANQGWDKLALHKFHQEGLLSLTGWIVSDDRLEEAEKESERIITAKNNRSPSKRRRTTDGSPSPEKRKSQKKSSSSDDSALAPKRHCQSLPSGTTRPPVSNEDPRAPVYPSYPFASSSWQPQWPGPTPQPQAPFNENSPSQQWQFSPVTTTGPFVLQANPQWTGSPWPTPCSGTTQTQYGDYYGTFYQPGHTQPSTQVSPPSHTIPGWNPNLHLTSNPTQTSWPLSSYQTN